MKALKTRKDTICEVCGIRTYDSTGLCEFHTKRLYEVMDRDTKGTFGRPRINLGSWDCRLQPFNKAGQYSVMLKPSPENNSWDGYFHGTGEECITFVEDVVLDAKVRLVQERIIAKRKVLEAEEAEVRKDKWRKSQIWLIEHECEKCGAPCGSGCYDTNFETWDKIPGYGYNDTQNYSWEEAGYEHRPDNLGGVKTTYGCCMSCHEY